MNLIDYASPFEASCIEAYEKHGNYSRAADELGVHCSTVTRAIKRVEARAAAQGHAPGNWDDGVAAGYSMGKVTVHRKDGKIVETWERQHPDQEARLEAMRAAFEAMAETLPRQAPVKAPQLGASSLCNLYTYTDYHLGMLAWHKEGGADWDLKIAEQLLEDSFMAMLALSPDAESCILNIQGDFLHSDGLLPVTPASKHVLDVDGRFSKIIAAAIRVLRKLCNAALAKHKSVRVVICEGNHDETSSLWLRHMFAAIYDLEPRLSVNDSELPFYVEQFGSSLIGFHHGHKVKNDALPMLFAAQFPKIWGNTDHRYCNTGHYHHIEEKEHSGMIVTRHPTLSARDAYSSRHGYHSERAAMVQTYHKVLGRVFTNYIRPEMFELDLAA